MYVDSSTLTKIENIFSKTCNCRITASAYRARHACTISELNFCTFYEYDSGFSLYLME